MLFSVYIDYPQILRGKRSIIMYSNSGIQVAMAYFKDVKKMEKWNKQKNDT